MVVVGEEGSVRVCAVGVSGAANEASYVVYVGHCVCLFVQRACGASVHAVGETVVQLQLIGRRIKVPYANCL